MDMIEIGLEGEMIVVTFKPETGHQATCRIAPHDAVNLSCLMLRACNLRETVAIKVTGMALQVEAGRRSRAWLTIFQAGDLHLTACLETSRVREVGRRIHDQYLRAIGVIRDGPEQSIYVRQVSCFRYSAT
jgi:hypothetical protein